MFNLIYHLLLENHKWNRCSSGRVSVDSAAFFGYKFGYKILNSRKPSGSAGAKQLTNNLRMDAMNGSDGRDERCGWTRWTVRMDAMDSSDARSCARHMVRPFGWQFSTGCFLRMAPDTRGAGLRGNLPGVSQYNIFLPGKFLGFWQMTTNELRPTELLEEFHILLFVGCGKELFLPRRLFFREDSTPSAGSVRSTQMECAPVFGAFRRRKTLPPPQGGA